MYRLENKPLPRILTKETLTYILGGKKVLKHTNTILGTLFKYYVTEEAQNFAHFKLQGGALNVLTP